MVPNPTGVAAPVIVFEAGPDEAREYGVVCTALNAPVIELPPPFG
jgi:hypothetical protein